MAYRDGTYDTETCLGCNAKVEAGRPLCPACGAPIDVVHYAEMELALKPALRSARRALIIPAALSGLLTLFVIAVSQTAGHGVAAALPPAALTALFVLAAGGVRRWPFFATLLGLALFLFVESAHVVLNPAMLFPGVGLIVRFLMLFVLWGGVRAGYRARDLRRQAGRHDLAIVIAALTAAVVTGVAAGINMWRLVELFGF